MKTETMAAQTTADEVCKLAYEGSFGLLRLKLEHNRSFATKKDTVLDDIRNLLPPRPVELNTLYGDRQQFEKSKFHYLAFIGHQIKADAKSGRTPLHWAASGGHTDIVEYLLGLQVPVDERDETHWTALIIASSAGRTQIVYDLLGHDAEVNAINNNGQSSLHYAASKGHLEICEALVKYGADVECVDSLGHMPLHRAASKGNLNIVKFLIGHGAPLDSRDATGCTALHLACEDGNGEVARLLIDSGARTDIRNNDKQTAFELAPRALKRSLESSVDR